jgi:hypothetical protein
MCVLEGTAGERRLNSPRSGRTRIYLTPLGELMEDCSIRLLIADDSTPEDSRCGGLEYQQSIQAAAWSCPSAPVKGLQNVLPAIAQGGVQAAVPAEGATAMPAGDSIDRPPARSITDTLIETPDVGALVGLRRYDALR